MQTSLPRSRPQVRRRAVAAVAAQSVPNWLVAALALAMLTFVALMAPGVRAQPAGAPVSFADLAEKLLPAVVNISSSQVLNPEDRGPDMPQFPPGSPFEEFFKDYMDKNAPARPQRATSLGSGFVIDPSGLIVTNNHVIDGADEITVILQDDTNLKAELVGKDDRTDLALLRVKPSKPLPSVKFGDSDATRIGDWVLAIGNPFGLGGTVTSGILSARSRSINNEALVDFLQTDAAINRGNSGGPLFNLKGEVIGINTAIFSPSGGSVGIGFSVPSNIASVVIEQLKDYGRTRRGWLGVRIQDVTPEIAESLKLDSPRGALIADVTAGGPAEEAGLKAGDVVLSFDGKPVPEMKRLPRLVAETQIGKTADLEYWRDGKSNKVKVKVGDLEEAMKTGLVAGGESDDGGQVSLAGMTLAPLSDDLKDKYEVPDGTEGVVVTDVDAKSDAFEKGVRAGDIVREVKNEKVATPQDVSKLFAQAKEEGRKSVLVLISRQGDMRFVPLAVE
jgi:serine protease Do